MRLQTELSAGPEAALGRRNWGRGEVAFLSPLEASEFQSKSQNPGVLVSASPFKDLGWRPSLHPAEAPALLPGTSALLESLLLEKLPPSQKVFKLHLASESPRGFEKHRLRAHPRACECVGLGQG